MRKRGRGAASDHLNYEAYIIPTSNKRERLWFSLKLVTMTYSNSQSKVGAIAKIADNCYVTRILENCVQLPKHRLNKIPNGMKANLYIT